MNSNYSQYLLIIITISNKLYPFLNEKPPYIKKVVNIFLEFFFLKISKF